MSKKIEGIKVAILVADGFEQSEMVKPKMALDMAGALTVIVSPMQGKVKGWSHKTWGDTFKVDLDVSRTDPNDFDALLLPGGVMNPDTLRMNPSAINFIKGFTEAKKPIAAICHGPWPLINAEAVKGRTLTSWPSIKLDLSNAGAKWMDKEVVIDSNLVTSRKPEDIPAFNQAFIDLLCSIHPSS